MKSVWKYPFPLQDELIQLTMPAFTEILHVEAQRDVPCLWALVDTQYADETRYFRVHGTGHEMPEEKRKHVGSFQMMDGRLVFHLFEVQP